MAGTTLEKASDGFSYQQKRERFLMDFDGMYSFSEFFFAAFS